MHTIRFLPIALLALAGGAEATSRNSPEAMARIGQRAYVNGPVVTPLRVLEDSRCPMEARCVWAGQVRLLVRIGTGRNRYQREITSNKPVQIANGRLELVSVIPPQSTQRPLRPRDYRFVFRFNGGS